MKRAAWFLVCRKKRSREAPLNVSCRCTISARPLASSENTPALQRFTNKGCASFQRQTEPSQRFVPVLKDLHMFLRAGKLPKSHEHASHPIQQCATYHEGATGSGSKKIPLR